MRRDWIAFGLLGSSLFVAGCAGSANPFAHQTAECPILAQSADQHEKSHLSEIPRDIQNLTKSQTMIADLSAPKTTTKPPVAQRTSHVDSMPEKSSDWIGAIRTVSHQSKVPPAGLTNGQNTTLTIDGKTYSVQLLEQELNTAKIVGNGESVPQLVAVLEPTAVEADSGDHSNPNAATADTYPLNLQTALAMVGGQHPAVGFAQWRVQEAYAQLDQAEVLWLPSLQAGLSFHRHDGNYQASNGDIVDVNRSSFQYGFGAGATGAGTTPRPGLIAQFHMKDALFQPDIAKQTAWAHGHAANGVYQKQLLDVSLAYLNLLKAEQDLVILEASRKRTADLAQLTEDFASTGQGLRADADRMKTELVLAESRIAEIREQSEVASSRLARTLSVDANRRIVPLDPSVVPIQLVSLDYDKASLISTGLAQRPELKEAQALVSAACERYQKEKYSPFVPSILLGFSTSGFGGGVGSGINNVDGRYDFDALMTWEVRNLGLGEKASRREMSARVQQAKYEQIQVLDQIAQEISEAHSQVIHRANRIDITQRAIQSAQDSFERNLARIRDGQGLPIEVLQSIRALEDAHRAYLKAIIDYNEAQFRLQWSLGWPVFAAT